MIAARSVDPEACDRCGVQKATKHLEFAFSGPWNACVDCRRKLIAFHAKGGNPKRDRERKKSFLAWHSQRPFSPERRTANRSAGSRLWTPEDLAHKARRVA